MTRHKKRKIDETHVEVLVGFVFLINIHKNVIVANNILTFVLSESMVSDVGGPDVTLVNFLIC